MTQALNDMGPGRDTPVAEAPCGGSSGAFPKRRDTLRAEVLADLLTGEEPTAMQAVRSFSTTRLADHVFALREMGWPIETGELTMDTKDGRVAKVAAYKLSAAVIAAARSVGAAEFCSSVRTARQARRAGLRQ
jgi:hypothetical protein